MNSQCLKCRFLLLSLTLLVLRTVPSGFAMAAMFAPQAKYESAPINYSAATPSDPVYQLARSIEAGEVSLEWSDANGYLESLLSELKIPASSQGLVFSKTSLQVSRINPQHPRAIYFNDNVYVGWVQQGSVIEISAADPKLGATFYSIKQDQTAKKKIVRETSRCLQCHGASHTRGRPGHIVRSVYPNETGMPEYALGTHLIGPDSKFEERFGGWYVTGSHGDMTHLGNSWMPKSTKTGMRRFDRDLSEFDSQKGANRKTLAGLLDVSPYLKQSSDLVAQLVLQHQVHMHNVLTEASYSGLQADFDGKTMNKIFKRKDDFKSESTIRRYHSAAEKVVKALFFCDEILLASPVSGGEDFAKDFQQQGPSDDQGRSLRQLDLNTRLLRYPCSFLIYSESFKQLPKGVLDRVYLRINEVLTGKDNSENFQHLSEEDRNAVLSILQATGVLPKT